MHTRGTIGSLCGGLIGSAGGIAIVTGCILAHFILDVSLVVIGVGLGIAAAGGIIGAISNICKMFKKKSFQDKIRDIVDECQSRLGFLIQHLNIITSTVHDFQALLGAGRAVATITQIIKVVSIIRLGAEKSKNHSMIGGTLPITASLALILDLIIIFVDCKEIHEMRKDHRRKRTVDQSRKMRKTNSNTLRFISELKQLTEQLRKGLKDLQEIKGNIDVAF